MYHFINRLIQELKIRRHIIPRKEKPLQSYTTLSICMNGFALNVLLPISSILIFLFFTWEFLKLQNILHIPCKDLKSFLPRGTQKGVFIVIAKDNIDLSTRSSIATVDYHRTGLSLIQMHPEESESTVWYYIYSINNAIHSLKIDSLPEEYSQISSFLSDLAVYYALNCNDPIQLRLFYTQRDSLARNRITGYNCCFKPWFGMVSCLSEMIQEA